MSSPEPDSKIVSEDEEERIYQLIYGMGSTDGNQEKEKILITPSPELSPVHLEMSAERKGSEGETAYSTKPEQTEEDEQADIPLGPEMYPLNNIRDIPVVNAEEKPWRRPGADISDYFNYGFDEESWNTYCSKQSKLRTASRKLYTQVMAEKWKTKHEETDSYSAYPSSDSKSTHAFRPSNAASDVCGEQPGPSRTVEGRSRLNAKGKKPKVVTQMSPEEDRITSYEGLTLPSPFKVDDLFAYTSPPSFLFRCGPPPPPPPATLKGRDSEGSDQLSTSTSSGVPFLNQRSNPIGAIKTAKAWECFIRQEKSDSHKGRTRHYDHDKESQRDRDKAGESSSFTYNRGEARMRQRDNAERGHKSKTFERLSGEMEEWQKERRHREYKSACSSSSRNRSEGDEDRDSQSRHKRKKAKRNRKDKETCKVSSDE